VTHDGDILRLLARDHHDPHAVPAVPEVAERIPGRRRGLRTLLPFAGPAVIASVAYMDPGNFATNIQAGAAESEGTRSDSAGACRTRGCYLREPAVRRISRATGHHG